MLARDRIKQALRDSKAKKKATFEEFRSVMLVAVDFSYLSDREAEIRQAFDEFCKAKEVIRIVDWLAKKAPSEKKDELIWVVSERGLRLLELEEKVKGLDNRTFGLVKI